MREEEETRARDEEEKKAREEEEKEAKEEEEKEAKEEEERKAKERRAREKERQKKEAEGHCVIVAGFTMICQDDRKNKLLSSFINYIRTYCSCTLKEQDPKRCPRCCRELTVNRSLS